MNITPADIIRDLEHRIEVIRIQYALLQSLRDSYTPAAVAEQPAAAPATVATVADKPATNPAAKPPRKAPAGSVTERIERALSKMLPGQPVHLSDLFKQAAPDAPYKTAQSAVTRFIKRGLLTRAGNGIVALAGPWPTAPEPTAEDKYAAFRAGLKIQVPEIKAASVRNGGEE